jgi:hypothetical protein
MAPAPTRSRTPRRPQTEQGRGAACAREAAGSPNPETSDPAAQELDTPGLKISSRLGEAAAALVDEPVPHVDRDDTGSARLRYRSFRNGISAAALRAARRDACVLATATSPRPGARKLAHFVERRDRSLAERARRLPIEEPTLRLPPEVTCRHRAGIVDMAAAGHNGLPPAVSGTRRSVDIQLWRLGSLPWDQ